MIPLAWCLLSLWIVVGAYLPDYWPTWVKILIWWPVTFITMLVIVSLTKKRKDRE